jgi:glycosyltransferase involved in cell wall biosynthesis
VTDQPEVSVVLTTYNRARVLPGAIEGLLDQDLARARYEIIIVDNNSTDETRQVVESFQARATNLRYIFEARQGVAYGRNTGILAAHAPLIAFTDDDVRVARNWLRTILSVLASYPDVAGVGGRVLPDWPGSWPAWLTREHWSPLALLDYGDAPLHVTAARRLCLITANAAYRRDVLERVGMFSPHVQTVGREVATEDHELLLRLWRAGEQGLYWPGLTATASIDPERMRRRYHRRWHHRHGRFLALMHDEELERTRMGRLLGVPAHIYRHVATDFAGWISALVRLQFDAAFRHETNLWSHSGFLTARWQEFFSPRRRTK